MEVKKTETKVPSFFDIFVKHEEGEEVNGELVAQSEFFRDELIRTSLEFFLDIISENSYESDEDSEEEQGCKTGIKGCKKKCC